MADISKKRSGAVGEAAHLHAHHLQEGAEDLLVHNIDQELEDSDDEAVAAPRRHKMSIKLSKHKFDAHPGSVEEEQPKAWD